MVVRLFEFLLLLPFLFPKNGVIALKLSHPVSELAYAGSYSQNDMEIPEFYRNNRHENDPRDTELRRIYLSPNKNSRTLVLRRILNSKTSEDRIKIRDVVSNLSERRKNITSKKTGKIMEDVPRRYVIVLNIGTNQKEFSLYQEKAFSSKLSQSLKRYFFPGAYCKILHNTPISLSKVQLEVYCKSTREVSLPNFIPAPDVTRSLDTFEMRPFLKQFNVTAYGIKESPEMDLAVYQEMWFPVAVVAGMSVLLIILAIVCLLVCRRRMSSSAEEELKQTKQVDPEKLLYPAVHPIKTMSASMIQPEAGRVYTIAGMPPKPRKWTGSHLSLSDRRGSKASLVLDLTSSSTDLGPGSPAPSIRESPVEEKLSAKSKLITFEELGECVDNTKQLYAEFWEIPMNHPPAEERLPGSSYRNRYPSILPNSRTRVSLPQIPDDPLSSYINANVLKGYGEEINAFIATQGPLSCTVNDFWRMIWYHHCPIIVMITKLKERNETKCERYWPDPTFRMQEKYGDIVVTFDSALGRDGYQITSLYISHSQSLESPRRLYHYWYTAWPDHGVPDSPRQLLQLVDEVHLAQDRDDGKTGPVVVHCSAGIGRTGCFVATSIGIKQIQKENKVDILKIVCGMRMERGGMVETDSQYEFVYRALYHHWRQLRTSGGRRSTAGDVVLEAMFDDK
ncbi:receptor-type tyrosine-protein phosphatase R [Nematostella vectensis]|uniref:receptor-type tyrosine-protein phosphatase R n=1 Tax=Nematostella vectensis TaxID=45351 RepID=UPI0013905890|nr:receptor-type tyrosine-protein phosphatase R [Nematostella vectensis]